MADTIVNITIEPATTILATIANTVTNVNLTTQLNDTSYNLTLATTSMGLRGEKGEKGDAGEGSETSLVYAIALG